MTDQPEAKTIPTITVWIIKFALQAGVITKAKAWEFPATGRIKIAEGDMRNLEFEREDYDTLESIARAKAQRRLDATIKAKEADLERLRKLDFSGPADVAEVGDE